MAHRSLQPLALRRSLLQYLVFVVFFFLCISAGHSQDLNKHFKCSLDTTQNAGIGAFGNNQKSIFTPHGGVFTPKKEIRMLIIFAGTLSSDIANPNYEDWPYNAQNPSKSFPAYIDTNTWSMPELLYKNLSSFNNIQANDKSISRFLYDMSMGELKVVADVYPRYIHVPNQFSNNQVLQNIVTNDPNFPWSRYDNRINPARYAGYFRTDNSTYLSSPQPDGAPDYIVTVYRSHWGPRGATAHSILDNVQITVNGLNRAHGFTFLAGAHNEVKSFKPYGFRNVFLHELCHELYRAPHVYGNNYVIFDRYSFTRGWSMMSYDYGPSSANAFERYKLGWIQNNTHVTRLTSPSQNGTYTLTDFVTTGKALCIEIPSKDTTTQRLWVEYRQGLTPWDKRDLYTLDENGNTIAQVQPGVFMFIEDHPSGYALNKDFAALNNSNYFKALSPNGAYDVAYTHSGNWNAWNLYDYFQKLDYNPLSFSNQQWFRRRNTGRSVPNVFERIVTNLDPNGPGSDAVEGSMYISEGGQDYWGNGSHYTFKTGDRAGIDEKMVPASYPKYIYDSTDRSGPIVLNGVSIRIISITNGVAAIEVKLNDVEVKKNQRFTGNVTLPNLAGASPDLLLKSCVTLTFNASKVPNKTILGTKPHYLEPFVSPTIFRIKGHYKQEENATTEVSEGSAVILEGDLELDGGTFRIGKYSTLLIRPNAKITVGPRAHLVIEDSAYLRYTPGQVSIAVARGGKVEISPNVLLAQSNRLVRYELADTLGMPYVTSAQVATTFQHTQLVPSMCAGNPHRYCQEFMTLVINTPYATNPNITVSNLQPSGATLNVVQNNGSSITFGFNYPVSSFTVTSTYTTPTGPISEVITVPVNYIPQGGMDLLTGNNECDLCLVAACPFEPGGGGGIGDFGARVRKKPNSGTVKLSLAVVPNPSNGTFTIQDRAGIAEKINYRLVNMTGQVVAEGMCITGQPVSHSNLSNSLYKLYITHENHTSSTLLSIQR